MNYPPPIRPNPLLGRWAGVGAPPTSLLPPDGGGGGGRCGGGQDNGGGGLGLDGAGHEGGGGGTTAAEVLELELDLIQYAREAPRRVNTHWTSWPTRQYATTVTTELTVKA